MQEIFPISMVHFSGAGHALKQYDKAIKDYSTTIVGNSKNIYAICSRAFIYLELKKYQLAINDFTEALQIDPKCVAAYHGRAMAYKKLGLFEQAENDEIMYEKLKN